MNKFTVLSLLLCAFLGGCSSSDQTPSPTAAEGMTLSSTRSIELLLSRRAFSRTDFEQYKLFNNKLFVECGEIARGRFMPKDQDLFEVTPEKLSSLEGEISELNSYRGENKLKLPEPGKNINLADAGQLILKIETASGPTEVRTSVDAVAKGEIIAARKVKRVVEGLREIALNHSGNQLCDKLGFYGLK